MKRGDFRVLGGPEGDVDPRTAASDLQRDWDLKRERFGGFDGRGREGE